jgi:hypothetical protein
MKNVFTSLALICFVAVISSFLMPRIYSVGAIGDVKYSVLTPDLFIKENGKGWVLMDDKIPLTGSDLSSTYKITSIPDARGLFIRCLNNNREDNLADPYKKENGNRQDRPILSTQEDSFRKHSHGQKTNRHATGPDGAFAYSSCKKSTTYDNESDMLASVGGNETRPNNLALYTYIKINK